MLKSFSFRNIIRNFSIFSSLLFLFNCEQGPYFNGKEIPPLRNLNRPPLVIISEVSSKNNPHLEQEIKKVEYYQKNRKKEGVVLEEAKVEDTKKKKGLFLRKLK